MTAPRLRTLAFLALAAAPAHADFVASTGQMDLSDATMAFGFEAADLAITVWDRGLLPIDPATSTVTGEALEGARALELGGALSHATLALGEALAPLAARRIALRLWVQPRGVDLVAAVEWHSHASPLTPSAHAIHLAPTGRVTSDGWRELSTGPFDAAFMGALPDRLLVTDGTLGAGTDLEPVTLFSPAPTLRARLDAVGVYDLGPALVPTVACTALDESPCGPDGRCLAGRCVDGAVVGGRPPLRHADRVATLARRAFVWQQLHAERSRDAALAALPAQFAALADGPAHRVHPGITALVSGADMSHARPSDTGFRWTPAPLCVVWGVADLLPGAPEAPLVATLPALDTPLGLPLGAAITLLDGVPPAEWMAAVAGDWLIELESPELRATRLGQLMGVAGPVVTVAACPDPAGSPCAPEAVQTITVDLGERSRAALRGELAAVDPRCDWRIRRPSDLEVSAGGHAVSWGEPVEGVRWIAHDGFESDDSARHEAFAAALAGPYDGIVLDQRTGNGGLPREVAWLLGHLLDADEDREWLGLPRMPDAAVAQAIAACTGEADQPAWCQMVMRFPLRGAGPEHAAAAVPLVVLTGVDASGNDFFLEGVATRAAPTLRLGVGTSEGWLGAACPEPVVPGDAARGGMQSTDALLIDPADPPTPPYRFRSGPGIAPDARCLQRQSDLLAGVDTCLEQAIEWLKAQRAATP